MIASCFDEPDKIVFVCVYVCLCLSMSSGSLSMSVLVCVCARPVEGDLAIIPYILSRGALGKLPFCSRALSVNAALPNLRSMLLCSLVARL